MRVVDGSVVYEGDALPEVHVRVSVLVGFTTFIERHVSGARGGGGGQRVRVSILVGFTTFIGRHVQGGGGVSAWSERSGRVYNPYWKAYSRGGRE